MSGSDETLFDSILDTYHVKLSVGEYLRPRPFEKSKWEKKYSIILPLPSELRDGTSVSYTQQDQEFVADVLNGDIGSGAMGQVLRNTGQAIGALTGGVTNEMLPPERVTSAIQQLFGTAPNPNPAVMFQGPNLRRFGFNWLLQPRNKTESDKISRIVKKLKASALPRNIVADSAALLKYPHLCQLNFFPWDTQYAGNDWGWGDKSIIKIKKCFMTNVDVDYTPGNLPAFYEGTHAPAVARLSIEFQEIEYMLSNDWDESAVGKSGSLEVFQSALGETGGFLKDAFGNAATEVGKSSISLFGSGATEEQSAQP